MSDIVIKAENIGKLYKLGEIGTGTISHDLNRWWARVRGKEDPFAKIGQANDRTVKGDNDWVWALQDINFEVKQGEVLGIIGRNGAGKSTLLKILSKVTTPTTGRIKVKGRIASLLEVGTGFHPELTGRENIFLNGAILGMTKAEIKSKFNEIVDFAGVERYIDTPVKRYSSGMYVRLAFAVAAFLEPEILIIDEVLAVGDAEFQKKCLGRMKDVSVNDGRTVLFVSHQMGTIAQLCNRGVLLNKGTIEFQGDINSCINEYLNGKTESFSYTNVNSDNKIFYISQAALFNDANEQVNNFDSKGNINLRFGIVSKEVNKGVRLSCTIQSRTGEYLTTFVEDLTNHSNSIGEVEYEVSYKASIIAPNFYAFRLALFIPNGVVYDLIEMVCPFQITDTGSDMSMFEGINYGHYLTQHTFKAI